MQNLLTRALKSHARGMYGEAIEDYRAFLTVYPDHVQAITNLGMALWSMRDERQAIAHLRRALDINPGFAAAWNNLGALHLSSHRNAEAESCFRRAATLDPTSPDPVFNLAKLLLLERRMEEAEAMFAKVHSMAPGRVEPLLGISRIYYFSGRLEEALKAVDQASLLAPGHPLVETFRLLLHNYRAWDSVEALREAHLAFGRELSGKFARLLPEPSFPAPSGRIRVGYLASNWHDHSNLRCSLPVFEAHDRDRIELFCYHLGEVVDGLTDRLKAGVEHWRDCSGLSSLAVAQRIQGDSLAILVGQEGYFQPDVVEVLAHRVAPIQVTWSGYPHSWGLPTVDYRITDAVLDPPAGDTLPSRERLVRLPWFRSFLPPVNAPDPGPPPALKSGYPTFVSFNNLAKIGDSCVSLWAEIMKAVPLARLLIGQSEEGLARDGLHRRLREHGMDMGRVSFLPRLSEEDYLNCHRLADIHLDSSPYSGVTIAASALWMGLPSVCLGLNWAASLEGASQVIAAGFPELVVQDPESYVALNIRLAQDLPGLAAFRSSARARMAASPLLDGAGLARNLEDAFEAMMKAHPLPSPAL